jgi:outer membrane receptor protein involved in Fe transport
LLSSGFDVRQIDGQTHERFRNLGSGYTRTRVAGGDQLETGVFLQDTWTPSDTLQLHAALRGALHQNSDGILRESDLESDTTLVDERYPNRDRSAISARTGALFTPTSWLETRLSAYTGSRQPTLNELYRPFRLGTTSTLANPELEPEKIHGSDLGFKFSLPQDVTLQIGAFYNILEDPILSITEVQGPGFFPGYGFLPQNGVGARRRNIDQSVVKGLEAGVRWQISEDVNLHGSWLLTDAKVTDCRLAPELEGRTLAQVPSQQASLGVDGGLWKLLRWNIEGRWISAQFDDDLNQRRLREFFSVDAQIRFRLHECAEIYGAVENLFDAELQTRVDPSGIVSVASPRIWTTGVRIQF